MKILVLIGSGRKDGNTTRVVELVQGHLEALAEQTGVTMETETLFLNDLDISSCRGCRLCFDRGEDACPLKDDIPEIREKFDAADGLILASPVYVNDVSGRQYGQPYHENHGYYPAYLGGAHFSQGRLYHGYPDEPRNCRAMFRAKVGKDRGKILSRPAAKAIPEALLPVPHGVQNSATCMEEGATGRPGLPLLA